MNPSLSHERHDPDESIGVEPVRGRGTLRAREPRSARIESASWLDGAVCLDHRRWRCAAAEMQWQAAQHLIVLTERGGTRRTEVRIGGERHYAGRDRAGSLSFIPAGADRTCVYEGADLDYVAVWVDPAAVHELLPHLNLSRAQVNIDEPVVGALLQSLRGDLEQGQNPGDLYISPLVSLMLQRLAAPRSAGGKRGASDTGRHGAASAPLSRPALDRVLAFIDAHLSTDLRLEQLAAQAGLRVDSFGRRFKASTGVAPYAYVTARRIERACHLLRSTRREVGEIGLDLGFSSASHFASTFRREMGLTPRTYREASWQ